MGSGATIRARSGLHLAIWTDTLDSVTITAWARQIDAALLSQGPEVEAQARGWNFIIVLCVTPDPATRLANIGATPTMYQLVHAASDPRGPSQAAIAWILVADPDHLYLAQANPHDDCQAMLLAAIGRGTGRPLEECSFCRYRDLVLECPVVSGLAVPPGHCEACQD